MKQPPKIATTIAPVDPEAFYFRLNYHTFFFGPFKTEKKVAAAIRALDKWDEMWDYDGFVLVNGLTPLPQDLVLGLPRVARAIRKRLEDGRKRNE